MNPARYQTLAADLTARFGQRVRKLSLHAGFTCPNRDGALSFQGCSFCEPQTFSPAANTPGKSLAEQIEQGIAGGARQGIHRFIAYFQAYTNTYGPIDHLRTVYGTIRAYPEIIGLAIGTRPDCVDREKLGMISQFSEEYAVWLEYGLQSIHPQTLRLINRGHGPEAFYQACELTREFPGLQICSHVVLGLPGESQEMELETAKKLAELKCEGVKLHPLHVVQGTALAHDYQAGRYKPLTLEEYVTRVVRFLEVLWPKTVIHRLTADALGTSLLAPLWLKEKNRVVQGIQTKMEQEDTWQGKRYAE